MSEPTIKYLPGNTPHSDVPRVPDELLASDLADWIKLVWITIRKVQGDNGTAFASIQHYATRCGKSRPNVSAAIKLLESTGWIERLNGRYVRCRIGPQKAEELEKAHIAYMGYTDEKRIQDIRNRIQGIRYRIQGIHPSESIKESRKESSQKRARASKISSLDKLVIDASLLDYAKAKAPDVDPSRELEQFANYCQAKGKTYKDYLAAFRNWLINAQKYAERDRARLQPVKPKPIATAQKADHWY